MAIKFKRVAILIVIGMATIFSTCKKGGLGCSNTVYNFQTGMKIYPDNSNFQINDTFWLELNIPTNFTDIVSGKTIDFSSAQNFGTIVGFVDYSMFNNPVAAAGSFSTYLLEGTRVENPHVDQIREYLFSEVNSRYVFKLAIIPKTRGTFGVGVGNAQNVYRASDKCTKAFFSIILKDTEHHYYLNPNINSSNSDTTQPSSTFYFKVN